MVNVTASYSQKHFLLEALSTYQIFPLVTAGFFWQVLESIHKFVIELNTLKYLFVRGWECLLTAKEEWDYLGFHKKRDFLYLISYNYQVLLGIISQLTPFLHPLKNVLPLPFSLAKKKIYMDTHLKEALSYLFLKLPRCSLFPQTQ